MTNSTETNTLTSTIYVVEAKESSNKSDWLKVGVVWEHNDKDDTISSRSTLIFSV